MVEKQYQLTPIGLVVWGVMNGITKISLERNTPPNAFKFDGDDIYDKSEPQLTEKAIDRAISFLSFHNIIKRA